MRIWIDLLDSTTFGKTGSGPITTATDWSNEGALNKSGQFSFSVPINEPKLLELAPKMGVNCYGAIPILTTGTEAEDSFISVTSNRLLGGGIVESMSYSINSSGETVVNIQGMDWLYLLNRTTLIDWKINMPFRDFVDEALPDGWSFYFTNQADTDKVPLDQRIIYLEFDGTSVLNALINVATKEGCYFRLSGVRQIEFFKDFKPPRIRAVDVSHGVYAEEAPEICIIDKLTINNDGHDIVNRVFGFGGDWLGERYGLVRQWFYENEAAYDFEEGERPVVESTRHGSKYYYMQDDTSVSSYGAHEVIKRWNNIHPHEDTVEAHRLASAQLKRATSSFIDRYKDPRKAYTLDVAKLDLPIELNEQVLVLYRDVRQGIVMIDLSETLPIYGLTTKVDQSGLRIVSINVSSDGYEPEDEESAIVNTIQDVQANDPTVNAPPSTGGDNVTIINEGDTSIYHGWNVIRRVPHTNYTKPSGRPNRLDADKNGARQDVYAPYSLMYAEDHYDSTPDQPSQFRLSMTIAGYNAAGSEAEYSVGAEMSFEWNYDPDITGNTDADPRDWVQVRVKDDTTPAGWSRWRKLAWRDEVPGIGADARISVASIEEMPTNIAGSPSRYLATDAAGNAFKMSVALNAKAINDGEIVSVPADNYLAVKRSMRIDSGGGIIVEPGASMVTEAPTVSASIPKSISDLGLNPEQAGQIAISLDGESVEIATPLIGEGGWIVDEITGVLLVVDER